MAERGDVIDFEPAVIVAARQAGLTISETADLPAFLHPAVSSFLLKMALKMWKYPVSSSSLGQSALSMSGIREKRPDTNSAWQEGNSKSDNPPAWWKQGTKH